MDFIRPGTNLDISWHIVHTYQNLINMEPRRFLTPSGRTWRAREAKMGALEASPRASGSALEAPRWFLTPSERTWRAPRASGSALEALGTRLERRWGVLGRLRETKMDAKWRQNPLPKGIGNGFRI